MSTRCPRCGGFQHQVIAPGFVECVSPTIAGVVPPGLHSNTAPMPVPATCGHRYHVGTANVTTPCACGLFSIGNCVECGAALCGDHGIRDETGAFVCIRHVEERRAEAAAQQLEAQVANRRAEDERYEAERHRWEAEVVEALLGIDDPMERLVRCVGGVCARVSGDVVFDRTDGSARPTAPRRYNPVLPEFRALNQAPPWDDAAIAKWFAGASRQPPSDLKHWFRKRRGLFGTRKGWLFSGEEVVGSSRFGYSRVSIAVFANGETSDVNYCESTSRFPFGPVALHQMVELLEPIAMPAFNWQRKSG
jgi:hypothetical protein